MRSVAIPPGDDIMLVEAGDGWITGIRGADAGGFVWAVVEAKTFVVSGSGGAGGRVMWAERITILESKL
jgi:hypothetical protein